MKREVKSCQLHDHMFVAGLGQIKNMLPGDYKDVKLSLEDGMILVSYKGSEFGIPVVNCKNIVFKSSSEKSSK